MMDWLAPPKAGSAAPSGRRSRVALPMTTAAASGRFELQVCAACGWVQYPPRESCCRCLSDELLWRAQDGSGELLSRTVLHHSHDPYFRSRTPLHVGLVRLDCGVSVVAHLSLDVPKPPARVLVRAHLDRGGAGVLVAYSKSGTARLGEMCSDPRDANVLVTNGRAPHSQALVRALADAGSARIWVGFDSGAEPPALRDLPQVTWLRLDVADAVSVKTAAAAIGCSLDILINTADAQVTGAADTARAEMEAHYFGLLNLVQHFASPLSERAARSTRLCPAWVNVLSVSGLPGHDSWGTYGASMAAARSVSQCLRVQLRPAGVRLVTVYTAPLDDDRSERYQVAKLGASAFAKSIVEALRTGVEDVTPGEAAPELKT